MISNRDLLKKYDVPVPRYTSYPTVPYWNRSPSKEGWIESLQRAFSEADSGRARNWSLYVHIPFCETLCTFCGCNTVITRSHSQEDQYVAAVIREFEIYRQMVPAFSTQPLSQFHLGGGTPTFLRPEALGHLVSQLMRHSKIDRESFDGSVELDPRRTNKNHLTVLRGLGFNRVSLGVQDFDAEVQRLVNRIQPYAETESITRLARELGYESVNFDLIYGLPKQTLPSFARSLDMTIELRPDRIALYSFALVPWIKPAQRLFRDEDLPVGAEKRELYEMAYGKLKSAGYLEIGMDHFALPNDKLARSMTEKSLHRNFMGYTEARSDVMLGLGVSAISEAPDCFHQNEKVLPLYLESIEKGLVPTLRGHVLSEAEQFEREQILAFMTRGEVRLRDASQENDVRSFLSDMIADGLVDVGGGVLRLSEKGRPFLRNACVSLDQRLRQAKPETRVFSSAL